MTGTMAKLSAFFLMVLLFFHSSSGGVGAVRDGGQTLLYSYQKMKLRKLQAQVVLLDYDETGPNTKHDPKKGRPGGKNR